MKKNSLFITILLFVCNNLFAQDGLVLARSSSTITLDSTQTVVVYHEFYNGKQSAFGTTAPNPADAVRVNDQLIISGRIDSLKASNPNDSLKISVEFLDLNGYVIGELFWLDFTNNDTSATAVENAFTPFNRSAAVRGTTSATFWCDLSGLLKPYHGLKISVTHSGFESTADSIGVIIDLSQGISGLRN